MVNKHLYVYLQQQLCSLRRDVKLQRRSASAAQLIDVRVYINYIIILFLVRLIDQLVVFSSFVLCPCDE